MILQPVDWYEHDKDGNYVIDVFGRCENKEVACVRLTGFKPYFYVDQKPDLFDMNPIREDLLKRVGEIQHIIKWNSVIGQAAEMPPGLNDTFK